MSALAILSLVKRFWPYAVGALLVLAFVAERHHYGKTQYNAGAHSRDGEVAQLTGSIAAQNAAIEQLRTASAKATVDGNAAATKAAETRKANAALSARLKAAGGSKGGSCPPSAVNREGWEALK